MIDIIRKFFINPKKIKAARIAGQPLEGNENIDYLTITSGTTSS